MAQPSKDPPHAGSPDLETRRDAPPASEPPPEASSAPARRDAELLDGDGDGEGEGDGASGAGPAARILQAAEGLFCERGFDGVSVRDIAERAGVRKASVFYHFGSKDALFQTVLDGYYAAQRERMQAVLSAARPVGADVRATMHELLAAYLEFIEQRAPYARLIQGILASGNEHAALVQRAVAPLAEFTVAALAGTVPARGPTAARQLLVTFTVSIVDYFTYAPALAGLWSDDPLGPDALAERRAHLHWLVDVVYDALTGPADPG